MPLASAQTQQTFTPKAIGRLAPGGDRKRTVLSRMPGIAELMKCQLSLRAADLHGDGMNEIVVVSLTCDAAGRPVVVLEDDAGRATPIFARKVAGRLAITNAKLNGYNALAAADKAGAIIKDPAPASSCSAPSVRTHRAPRPVAVVAPLGRASSRSPTTAQGAPENR